MVDRSPAVFSERIGLKSWNALSTGDDPQVRRMSQDLSVHTHYLAFGIRQATPQDLEQIFTLASSQASSRQEERRRGDEQSSPEMEWLTTHAEELSKYRGEWLLISGQTLIEHNCDIGEIDRKIALRRIKKPFLYYVPTAEEANFIF